MGCETIVYRRAELYEQVWAEPVRIVAKRYGISDVALAKTCRRLSVPIPGRGYWAEKAAGKSPVRPSLSALPEGVRAELCVSRHRPDAGPLVDAEVIARVQQERSSAKIVVLDVLKDPHPLVERSAKLLRKAKPDDGMLSVTYEPCIDILVAPASLDRGLRILDALIKALAARGLGVEVAAVQDKNVCNPHYGLTEPRPPRYVTRVRVHGELIEWRLWERWQAEMGPPPPPPADYRGAMRTSWLKYSRPEVIRVPNGVLALEILGRRSLGTRSTWKDGKHQRVEKCLNAFIAELFATADALRRDREECEKRHRQWDEEARRRKEAERKAAEDARNVKELGEVITRWRLARDIRLYVDEINSIVAAEGRDVPIDSYLGIPLAWASAYADRVDPVATLRKKLHGVHPQQS